MIRRYDRILSFNDTTPDKGLDVCHMAPLNASERARRGTQILELIQESAGSVTLVLQRPALQRLVLRRWNKELELWKMTIANKGGVGFGDQLRDGQLLLSDHQDRLARGLFRSQCVGRARRSRPGALQGGLRRLAYVAWNA